MSVETLRPEEQVRRIRACLAEAGYPDADVHWASDGVSVGLSGSHGVPDAVCWMAFQTAFHGRCPCPLPTCTGRLPCWACWEASVGEECADGNCHHPEGPSRPPVELLRRPERQQHTAHPFEHHQEEK